MAINGAPLRQTDRMKRVIEANRFVFGRLAVLFDAPDKVRQFHCIDLQVGQILLLFRLYLRQAKHGTYESTLLGTDDSIVTKKLGTIL